MQTFVKVKSLIRQSEKEEVAFFTFITSIDSDTGENMGLAEEDMFVWRCAQVGERILCQRESLFRTGEKQELGVI